MYMRNLGVVAISLMLSLAGCGGGDEPSSQPNDSTSAAETPEPQSSTGLDLSGTWVRVTEGDLVGLEFTGGDSVRLYRAEGGDPEPATATWSGKNQLTLQPATGPALRYNVFRVGAEIDLVDADDDRHSQVMRKLEGNETIASALAGVVEPTNPTKPTPTIDPEAAAAAARAKAITEAERVRQAFMDRLDEYIELRAVHYADVNGRTLPWGGGCDIRLSRSSDFEFTGTATLLTGNPTSFAKNAATDEVSAKITADETGARMRIEVGALNSRAAMSLAYEVDLADEMDEPWEARWNNPRVKVNGGPDPWRRATIEPTKTGTIEQAAASEEAKRDVLMNRLATLGPLYGLAMNQQWPGWAELNITSAGEGRYAATLESDALYTKFDLTGEVIDTPDGPKVRLESGKDQKFQGRPLSMTLGVEAVEPNVVLKGEQSGASESVAFTAVDAAYFERAKQLVEARLAKDVGLIPFSQERLYAGNPAPHVIRLDPDTGKITGTYSYGPSSRRKTSPITGELSVDELGFPVITLSYEYEKSSTMQEVTLRMRVLERAGELRFVGEPTKLVDRFLTQVLKFYDL